MLNPTWPVTWLDDTTIQVGWSRTNRFTGHQAEAVATCLRLMQQHLPHARYSAAGRVGLDLLGHLGALVDLDQPPQWQDSADQHRQRLRALSHTLGGPDAAAVVDARCGTNVGIAAPPGWHQLGADLSTLNLTVSPDLGESDLAVLVGRTGFHRISALMRRGVPHLAICVRSASIRVGPLVLPSRSACLRCLHLARTDRDRHYPPLAAALERLPPTELDPLLVAQASMLAARIVSWHVDGSTGPRGETKPTDESPQPAAASAPVALTAASGLTGRYWTVRADRAEVEQTLLERHPLCDCWWEPFSAVA